MSSFPRLSDKAILPVLAELKGHYPGFSWESQVWSQDGHRRSPYRVLMLFGLSSRTKDSLLTETCRKLFAECPDAASFLERASARPFELSALVRKGQAPFLDSAASSLRELGGKVPQDWEALMKINGIGQKISECVVGYAWGQVALPVDGNVCRVLGRIGGHPENQGPPDAKSIRKWLTGVFARHRQWMSRQGIALIDIHEILRLHAQVCCRREPACAQCPVSACGQRRTEYSIDSNSLQYLNIWNDWRELILEH